MVAVATLLNEAYAPTALTWAPNYLNAYAQAFGADLQGGQTPAQAYANASASARTYADQNRLMPGTAAFNTAVDSLKKLAIPSGGKFNDKTDLYVGEAMYNFANEVKWMDITVGASTREFVLNSHGTSLPIRRAASISMRRERSRNCKRVSGMISEVVPVGSLR